MGDCCLISWQQVNIDLLLSKSLLAPEMELFLFQSIDNSKSAYQLKLKEIETMKLKNLNPCKYSSRIGSTIRKEWEKSSSDAEWLFIQAHIKGTMPRKRLVEVTLNRIDCINYLMPDASQKVIVGLRRWIAGEEVDLVALRDAARAADAAAYAAADAAARAAAYAAAYAAYAAVAYAAADAAAYAAYAAVDIRKYITVEEVCGYLNLDPDEVLA
jgi:hypothetical protein